jgi:hypothetical protein
MYATTAAVYGSKQPNDFEKIQEWHGQKARTHCRGASARAGVGCAALPSAARDACVPAPGALRWARSSRRPHSEWAAALAQWQHRLPV